MASRLGVSNATVSRALNDHPEVSSETRARVLELAESTGYHVRVRRRPTQAIGLVYPTDPVRPDSGSFETAMLAGVLRGINEQRFDVTWVNIERDKSPDQSFGEFFRGKGLSGVLVRTIVPNSPIAEELADDGFPFMVIADRSDDPRVSCVWSDSRSDSARVIDHLVHLGHTRIGLASHAVLDSDHLDRQAGYLEGLRRHGLDSDPSLMVSAVGTLDGGRQAIERLLSLQNPPTAVYFTTPPATLGAMQWCHEHGVRIPQDLSVVGFDDSDTRIHSFPRYTAVCQDAEQMGFEAARWLTRRVAGLHGGGVMRERRPTSFSVQKSTGIKPLTAARLTPAGIVRLSPGATAGPDIASGAAG